MPYSYPAYDPEHNYCGPEGWKISFPSEFYGVNVNYACYQHDVDFAFGGPLRYRVAGKTGNKSAFRAANKDFRDRMLFELRNTLKIYDPRYFLAWRRIRKMYLFVAAFGFSFFNHTGETPTA